MRIAFGVLGPVVAWDGAGAAIALRGPRHREVLARLLVARGRVVPVATLVEDLWPDPPDDARGAVQTFVSALRRALEPDRRPRTPARLLVTDGGGYALRAAADSIDARRFEAVVAASRTAPPADALRRLEEAAGWWRGPAYADFPDQPWARPERFRLAELRLGAVETRLRVMLDLGRTDAALPDLDAHVAEHPWREEGWRLLALALYRAGRQKDALDVLRRARVRLATDLGLDPGTALDRLEHDILRHAGHLDPPVGAGTAAGRVWSEAVATYGQTATADARAGLRSSVDMLRRLAVTGGQGLVAARRQRVASVLAAEETGDADLTARVIGGYDVPAVWSRSDDPDQAAAVVAAAWRTLAALPEDARPALRARLLATIAVESRGTADPRAPAAARRAEAIARQEQDPALLAFALDGVFMQSFHRCGLAPERDRVGAELVDLASRHGFETYEILGHLVRMQARGALGDLAGADLHADAADALADRYGSPLVAVFTTWHRARRDPAYGDAVRALAGSGMPGLATGLPALAELSIRIRDRRPAPTDDLLDWGPYEHWARPHILLARGDVPAAAAAVRELPDPPCDHLLEAMWCLAARAAAAVTDRPVLRRAVAALTPAAAEQAGAGSGLITLGPVADYLDELDTAIAAAGP